MALFIGEFGAEIGLYQVFGELFPTMREPMTRTFMLSCSNALMRGIAVVAYGRANADQFVGGNADANATAANQHASFSAAIENGATDKLRQNLDSRKDFR